MKIENTVITSLSVPETSEFRWGGCENCNNKLGNDVYKCKAHFDGIGDDAYYDVFLCHGCVNYYHNGGWLPEDCKNVFNI